MNLINDAWMPVVRAKSGKGVIAPWQIAEKEDPVLELATPRPDFQGAIYQFLIGLLQTGFAPQDQDEWLKYWNEPPDAEVLRQRLESLAKAFEFDNPAGVAFMQDFDLTGGETKGIAALLIEAPGGKTVRENLDHFVKRNTVNCLCKSCAAIALFTLQTNAPSGGVGHRVGLRGGGPLTTLVLPHDQSSIWQTLWLNVLDKEDMPEYPYKHPSDALPWTAPTRVSDKGGKDTTPEDCHPLQAYWGMPRRIRINFPTEVDISDCDLCSKKTVEVVTEYQTRNYGINYTGAWVHPLTPYRFDPKKEKPPLSLKGQQGGLGYRHWLTLTLADDEGGDRAALVVRKYSEKASELKIQSLARLWCFGFDMDNMKARCWYDHTFPLFNLDQAQRKKLLASAGELIALANDVCSILKKQVKAAWFRRPEDAKGDMNTVSMDFWERSERVFYGLLEQLIKTPSDQENPPPELYSKWMNYMLNLSENLFDTWVMDLPVEDTEMKRVIEQRIILRRLIHGCKSMKTIKGKTLTEKEGISGTIPLS